ncbi:MAG: tyrosine-type recombinase/integrase [Bacteroidetes bacterium]|nr:tyrosine-type recombinase/integrase [Bacteroidota bacterium]
MENQKFNSANYSFEPATHKTQQVIWIKFPYNKNLIEALKQVAKVKWSSSKKAWYAFDNDHHRQIFVLQAKSHTQEMFRQIHAVNQPAIQRYVQQLQLKAYSPNTIRTYTIEFAQLLKTLSSHKVDDLSSEKVRSYFLYCINTLKLSETSVHSRMNAVKFYFEQVLKRDKIFLEIPRPKKPSTLPKALSVQDVKKMLGTVENDKHKLLLMLCYGMGLRVSELVKLKVTDIDSKRMQVLVQSGKGKKDRYVNLPQSILKLLRAYYKEYKPKKFLFEGHFGGAYSVRSVQNVFKSAMRKAKIYKPVGIHSLRHSYATHLLEAGTDISFIQKLLGHNNIKTTLIYTQISDKNLSKVQSPLDKLLE